LNLDSQGIRLKLADFGLSRSFDVPLKPITKEVVTLWYRAPEILMGDLHYSTPVDIWSIGCILYELTTRKPLFPGDSEIDELFCIFRMTGTPNEQTWPGVSNLSAWRNNIFPKWHKKPFSKELPRFPVSGIDLLEKMLEVDPSRRITATGALRHEIFRK